MKREGMPTQRLEGKRVEERMGEGETERERERERMHAGEKERARERFGSSFYVSSSPWACPVQTGLSQESCLFYLKSSLWSSDLLLFYFRGLFPSLSFSHRHFGLLFPILPT